jgi:hypothetical protein
LKVDLLEEGGCGVNKFLAQVAKEVAVSVVMAVVTEAVKIVTSKK